MRLSGAVMREKLAGQVRASRGVSVVKSLGSEPPGWSLADLPRVQADRPCCSQWFLMCWRWSDSLGFNAALSGQPVLPAVRLCWRWNYL